VSEGTIVEISVHGSPENSAVLRDDDHVEVGRGGEVAIRVTRVGTDHVKVEIAPEPVQRTKEHVRLVRVGRV
jgi:hypothetical protein